MPDWYELLQYWAALPLAQSDANRSAMSTPRKGGP